MEEMRKAARAVHANLSGEAREGRKGMFRKLDRDGDGKISLQEFMTLFQDNNVTTSVKMFKLADQNGDGTLQFDEFVTLLYIFERQGPWCDGCGDFIFGGLFFTCKLCCLGRNGDRSKTYDLCIPCYHGRLFVHDHADFVDSHTLLATLQDVLSASAPKANPPLSHPGYYSTTSSAATVTAGQCYHYHPPIGRVQRKSGLEEVIDIAASFARGLTIGDIDALSSLFN